MKKKYRISTYHEGCYEVETLYWCWYWPFWVSTTCVYFSNIETATECIHRNIKLDKFKKEIIKEII